VGKRWVLNASPVILLAKAQVIHLVPQLCEQLVIPAGTVAEVRQGHMSDAGRAWLEEDGKAFIKVPVPIPADIAGWGLGLGETQVLAWVRQNPGFEGVLDDLKARHCANELHLPIIGSLRVLIILKEKRLIPAIRPALNEFRAAGSYFSEALIQRALKLAGES
jgi:predicted nucleic acid-binding protein